VGKGGRGGRGLKNKNRCLNRLSDPFTMVLIPLCGIGVVAANTTCGEYKISEDSIFISVRQNEMRIVGGLDLNKRMGGGKAVGRRRTEKDGLYEEGQRGDMILKDEGGRDPSEERDLEKAWGVAGVVLTKDRGEEGGCKKSHGGGGRKRGELTNQFASREGRGWKGL